TSFSRDWSSDVCSSDLPHRRRAVLPGHVGAAERNHRERHLARALLQFPGMAEIDQRVAVGVVDAIDAQALPDQRAPLLEDFLARSEEPRVSKEFKSRWM